MSALNSREKLNEFMSKGIFDEHAQYGRSDLDLATMEFNNRYLTAPRPQEPKMPEEAESEKPFILYLDSLNTSVNSVNM